MSPHSSSSSSGWCWVTTYTTGNLWPRSFTLLWTVRNRTICCVALFIEVMQFLLAQLQMSERINLLKCMNLLIIAKKYIILLLANVAFHTVGYELKLSFNYLENILKLSWPTPWPKQDIFVFIKLKTCISDFIKVRFHQISLGIFHCPTKFIFF